MSKIDIFCLHRIGEAVQPITRNSVREGGFEYEAERSAYPSTVVHLLDGQVNCGLPDATPPERFDNLSVPKERREHT